MKEESELTWDKKRIFLAIIILLFIGLFLYLFKDPLLNWAKKESSQNGGIGRVAGTRIEQQEKEEVPRLPSQEELLTRIETIKKEVSTLQSQDLTKREPVKKILEDLEELRASTEAQVVGGTKDIICEQAKKIFCGQ